MTEQDDNTWYPYAQMGDPDDLDFSSPGPNSGPSFLQQPQTPAPPYPPQAEFFYPDNPVTTQEEYQNLYATPADVLESPTFQEVDFPTPTMAGASFLQSGYDQGAAEPGDLTAQQEAVDPQLDQYRAAYAEWVGISVKQRPVPTAEVLAGYANRTNRSVNSGFIPYFEAAHGIPIGSLSRDVNSKKFEVLTRGAWQPETHTGTSYLSAEQMNALRDIGDPQVKPEQAYAIWQSLPVDQRVPPQGKVLAGWAGKTQVRHCNTGDIEAFESAHGIPTPTLTPLRRGQNRDRHISDLALKEGPGSWDPGTHNTSPLLSPAQVAALKIINAKNGSVEAAYTAWHGLIRMERMRPNSKIVAGFAGKKDHRSINISNLRAFERDENLPENSLEYVRQKEGKIIDVAVAGGKDWHQLYNGRQAPHGFEGFEGVNYSTPAATAGTNFLRDTYTQGVASGITPKALR